MKKIEAVARPENFAGLWVKVDGDVVRLYLGDEGIAVDKYLLLDAIEPLG